MICDKIGHDYGSGLACLHCAEPKPVLSPEARAYLNSREMTAEPPEKVPAVTTFPAATMVERPSLGIPSDDAARKGMPVFDGVLMYFPLACLAVSEVSKAGNDQHNPGQPMHWARGKSMDQMNTALRHMMDHGMGNRYDFATLESGEVVCTGRHLAKAAWRILAALQLDIETEASEANQG